MPTQDVNEIEGRVWMAKLYITIISFLAMIAPIVVMYFHESLFSIAYFRSKLKLLSIPLVSMGIFLLLNYKFINSKGKSGKNY